MNENSPLSFPCRFPVKVMGRNSDSFAKEIFAIASRHVPELDESALESRSSRSAKYLSVTMTFTAQSRRQLDDLYRELRAHPAVAMVL